MRKRATSPPGVVMPAPDAPKTQEAVRLIREEARRLLPECSGILGDVTAYTDASALWMLTRMHFSFLDSLVRLVGVPRGASEDWPAFVREARWFADPRNGADVRRVFAAIWLSGADLPAFRALLIHFLCCGLVAAEIRRRLEQRHYDGTVWAWGSNLFGELGDTTINDSNIPVKTVNVSGIAAIAAGSDHSLALGADGTIWAWGSNGGGQIGDGTTTHRYSAVETVNLSNVTAIRAGGSYSMALK